jgi:hypothetical protein
MIPNEIPSSAYNQEWDLHQGISDIVIEDLRVIISTLIPVTAMNTLIQFKRQIMLYFYIDTIEEELIEEHLTYPFKYPVLSRVNARVIIISEQTGYKISSGLITLRECWKHFIKKLEILFKLETENKTYYLIGNFSSNHYDHYNGNQIQLIRGPDKTNLKDTFPFHKRN